MSHPPHVAKHQTPAITGPMPRKNQMSIENAAASAPVHQLVGQLRELLTNVTPGPWRVLPCKHGFAIHGGIVKYDYDDDGDIRGPIGSQVNASAIVAAINALPALLAIAEAAADVVDIDSDPNGSVDANGVAIDALSHALSLLPNAKAQPADA